PRHQPRDELPCQRGRVGPRRQLAADLPPKKLVPDGILEGSAPRLVPDRRLSPPLCNLDQRLAHRPPLPQERLAHHLLAPPHPSAPPRPSHARAFPPSRRPPPRGSADLPRPARRAPPGTSPRPRPAAPQPPPPRPRAGPRPGPPDRWAPPEPPRPRRASVHRP